VAAAAHTAYDTGLSLAAVCDLEPYWESLRKVYAPFESGLPAPTGRVYHHEIPGGQLSNLRQQAIALGLGDRFEDIENAYAGADAILGHLVKVTPSSKVVGDLALALVGAGITAEEFAADPARYDIPESVIGFLRGELGDPPGGWPEPLRTKALSGRGPAKLAPLVAAVITVDRRRFVLRVRDVTCRCGPRRCVVPAVRFLVSRGADSVDELCPPGFESSTVAGDRRLGQLGGCEL
jgi:pyruvate carboxylase